MTRRTEGDTIKVGSKNSGAGRISKGPRKPEVVREKKKIVRWRRRTWKGNQTAERGFSNSGKGKNSLTGPLAALQSQIFNSITCSIGSKTVIKATGGA